MDLYLFYSLSLVSVVLPLSVGNGAFEATTSNCSCPSCNLTYQCEATGENIIWSGSVFKLRNCTEIILNHNQNISQSCNNGSISGSIILNEDNSTDFTSRLFIELNFSVIGRSVECSQHYNGSKLKVGNSSITVEVSHTYNMTKGSKYFLNFKWNSSVFSSISSAILYNISSSNCGSCPTTTTDTNVNCTNVPTAGECMFVLQTLVCGRSIGNTSHRFVLKTAESMRDPALLPALSTSVMVFMVAVIAGVILLIWFLYRRPCKTSGGLSQPNTVTATSSHSTHPAKNNSHLMMQDTHVYDYTTVVTVFDNKLASGIYGSTSDEVPRAQCYEDFVPTSGEGKVDLESLLAYLRGRVTFQWYKFGAALGVPSNVLENFVKDSEKYSEEKALIKVLEYWLKNHSTQPTWNEVANALKDIIWMS